MKKVLALVLAVMMMATVAFAAGSMDGNTVVNPGSGTTTDGAGTVLPGKTIKITKTGIMSVPGSPYVDSNVGANEKLIKDINSTNYSITSVKYNDGKSMVASVSFNNDKDQVEIKLNKDYDLTKAKKLDMTFTLKGKKVGKSDRPADIDIHVTETINFGTNTANIDADNDVTAFDVVSENVVNEFKSEKDGDTVVGAAWGTLEFTTTDDEVDIEVRVYDGDKLYLYNDLDADNDILKKYADTDADITFLNFYGEPTFNATATVRFYKEEGTYIYLNKDGNLTRVTAASAGSAGQTAGNVKWDEDEGAYVLKTRTLGKYVFSDKPLKVSAATDTPATTNPDTGANDVVGVATALAAVALVSAAAVSLKK